MVRAERLKPGKEPRGAFYNVSRGGFYCPLGDKAWARRLGVTASSLPRHGASSWMELGCWLLPRRWEKPAMSVCAQLTAAQLRSSPPFYLELFTHPEELC